MWKLILVSGDRKTHEEIKALLPKGVSLEGFTSLDELPRPHTPPAGSRFSEAILLIELSGEPAPAARLEPFRMAGIPLVALINSPVQRDAAYSAGFDDFLLWPPSPAELNSRLERLARAGAAAPPNSPAALERERQAAVGRLTSYFCHAVNNSMQTIRGAIDLAREEPGLSPEIDEYLAISRKETELIGAKINRLRQIYRPNPSPPEAIPLDAFLHEMLKMTADDLLRNNITVKMQNEPSLPVLQGAPDRISLAFLMMIFFLSEELGARGGGELRVRAARDPGGVRVLLEAVTGPGALALESPAALPPGLGPAEGLIQSERGRLEAYRNESGYALQIHFPAEGN
jgi:hypothetical protein